MVALIVVLADGFPPSERRSRQRPTRGQLETAVGASERIECFASKLAGMNEPVRDRPVVPDGYGTPESDEGILEWSAVENRLREATHYWMATTRPNGKPHVVPRWGVWLDGQFWYDGSPETVHVKNLNVDSSCALHLEDGRQAVIVEGRSEAAAPPGPQFGGRLSEAMSAKYGDQGYSPGPDSWEGPDSGGLRVLAPAKAMAWFEFPTDMTRFRWLSG